MGLFSRKPKEPEPHATRTITTSQHTYWPGSQITGTLTLECPTQRRVVRVEASFHGTCTTHLYRTESSGTGDDKKSETINYYDEADLFRHVAVLEKDFVARPGQSFSWPFHFAFPYETSNIRGEVYRKETACSPLYQVSPHSLPPTFALDLSHSTYAHVEYNVEVIIYFEDAEEPFTVRFQQLNFSPFPPQQPVQAPFLECVREVEKYASSRLVGQEKSFRHSIRDKFSSSTPSLNVTMKASVMPVITVGTTFSFFVCTELSNLSDPYAIDIREVRLRIKSLKLTKVTTHRAIRVDRGAQPEREETHSDSVLLNALPEARSVEPQVGVQKQLICPAAFEARIPGDCCPIFSTVTIHYACKLKAIVEVEICGKVFEHKFEMQDLLILPG